VVTLTEVSTTRADVSESSKLISDIFSLKGCHDQTTMSVYRRTRDVKATGHVIAVTSAVSELQCADRCLRRMRCRFFNYQNTENKCELLKDAKERSPSQGNVYHEFSRTKFKEVCFLREKFVSVM